MLQNASCLEECNSHPVMMFNFIQFSLIVLYVSFLAIAYLDTDALKLPKENGVVLKFVMPCLKSFNYINLFPPYFYSEL